MIYRPLTIIKLIVAAVPIGLLLWLLDNHLALTPRLTYRYAPDQTRQIVKPVVASTILRTADKDIRWRLSTNSFLFTVRIPRLIQALRVQVSLAPGNQRAVFLAPMAKPNRPVGALLADSEVLNTLHWRAVTGNGLTLWQREKRSEQTVVPDTSPGAKKKATKIVTVERTVKQYASPADFMADMPEPARVAVVGLDPLAMTRVADYRPSDQPLKLNHTLRGSHDFYVYAADEDIRLTFNKVDLNRVRGKSSLMVSVVRTDQIRDRVFSWLKTVTIGDDGMTDGRGRLGPAQSVEVRVPQAPAGLYLVRISTSEDVLLKNLTSYQRAISTQRLFLADGPAYGRESLYFTPVALIANGSQLTFAAAHDFGKQEVLIDREKHRLTVTRQAQTIASLSGETSASFPNGDVIVSSEGFLSVAGAELIPPQTMMPIDVTADPNLETFDYVLADYAPRRADQPINIDQTYLVDDLQLSGPEGKLLTFRIETPGLRENDYRLGLDSIKATLIRGPFPWKKISMKLNIVYNQLEAPCVGPDQKSLPCSISI